MWMFVAWIGLSIISALLGSGQSNTATTDATAGEVEGTTVDAASPVPVLFGTRLMAQANCVWYGDVGTTPIKSCSGGKK